MTAICIASLTAKCVKQLWIAMFMLQTRRFHVAVTDVAILWLKCMQGVAVKSHSPFSIAPGTRGQRVANGSRWAPAAAIMIAIAITDNSYYYSYCYY